MSLVDVFVDRLLIYLLLIDYKEPFLVNQRLRQLQKKRKRGIIQEINKKERTHSVAVGLKAPGPIPMDNRCDAVDSTGWICKIELHRY